MPEYQKRMLSVSRDERRELEEAKKRYDERYRPTDWGGFLQQRWALASPVWASML